MYHIMLENQANPVLPAGTHPEHDHIKYMAELPHPLITTLYLVTIFASVTQRELYSDICI